jgi:hypothetical protein
VFNFRRHSSPPVKPLLHEANQENYSFWGLEPLTKFLKTGFEPNEKWFDLLDNTRRRFGLEHLQSRKIKSRFLTKKVVAMKTHIIFALVGVGTLLVTAGTIRIVMTLFGYHVMPAWENKFRVKLPKFEFGLETNNLGIAACFVGIIVVGTPTFLLNYWGPVAELNAQESNLPVSEALELDGYSAAEETVWLNLTKRKELSDWDRVAGDFSPVNWSSRLVVKAIEPGVDNIALRFATSGAGIRPLELPSGAQWEKSSESKGNDIYNPFVDVLKGTSLFRELFDLNGTMRTYFMTLPVQQMPNQEFWYQLSYLNAFQGRSEEWAGKVVHADTDLITMNIAFPENKPLKAYYAFREPEHGKVRLPLETPDIQLSPDKRFLTWKIRDAKKGERYLIRWEW